VGPLQLAAFETTDIIGLRGGQWLWNGTDLVDNADVYAPIPLFRDTRWGDPVARHVFGGGRGKLSDYRPDRVKMHSPNPFWEWEGLFGREIFSHGPESLSSLRGKDVLAASPLPILTVGNEPHFFSAIEVAGGLVFSLRLGFNAGEFVDFVLGWWGGDLYSDDLELW
jgi:hypothetical protein